MLIFKTIILHIITL